MQPDMRHLKLEGRSMLDLALEATRVPVGLEDVVAHLKATDPDAHQVS